MRYKIFLIVLNIILLTSCTSVSLPSFYGNDTVYIPIERNDNSFDVSMNIDTDYRSSSSMLFTEYPMDFLTNQASCNLESVVNIHDNFFLSLYFSPSIIFEIERLESNSDTDENTDNEYYYSLGPGIQLQSSVTNEINDLNFSLGTVYSASRKMLGNYNPETIDIYSGETIENSYSNFGRTNYPMSSSLGLFVDFLNNEVSDKFTLIFRATVGTELEYSFFPINYATDDKWSNLFATFHLGLGTKTFYYIRLKVDTLGAYTVSMGTNI